MTPQPDLTFFCELPVEDLKNLFKKSSILNDLRRLNANISMGLLDFSKDRAEIVKKLTKLGIPVTAWILLLKEEGYWTNLDTVSATAACYSQFKKWTLENNLKWAAIGLDIEPSLERHQLFGPTWYREIPDILKRLSQVSQNRQSLSDLRSLICLIRADGFAIETYNLPFVVEERKSSSELISRVLGTPPLNPDREVLMLYSSFFKQGSDAILWSYGRQAQAIGLGSTGGGVELEEGQTLRSIGWINLRQDLLIAKTYTRHIYIFSLEGCVKNDILRKLIKLDWDCVVKIPLVQVKRVALFRKLFQGFLWIISHPLITTSILFALFHVSKIHKRS